MNYKTITFPVIAIVKGKHGQYVSPLITNYNQLDRFCLRLLKSRSDDNYYDYDPGADIVAPKEPTEGELSGKYASVVKAEYTIQLGRYKERLSEKKMYDNIKKAIETKNGKDAFDVLVFRSDYEYEEIEFHHLDKFNEDD